MKHQHLLLILLLGYFSCSFGQTPALSSSSYISVITCGPGEELYSTFGHSAIRVQDATLGIDVVYNYGHFNFNTPNFYLKFTRGKLLYSLSRERFENFLFSYELEKRWVKEQILDLTLDEKNTLFNFLEQNYQPLNRDYKYDFLFNNCATKIPAILEKIYGEGLIFSDTHLTEQYTFRQLIRQNIHVNSWSAFGIDLALGSVIDKEASPNEYMFLPNYVHEQLNNTILGNKPLVARERIVLDIEEVPSGNYFLASPLFWFIVIFFFVLTITYIDFRNKTRSKWLDFFVFFVTGIAGCLITFLWFFTDHTATAGNFNILWAFPANIALAFMVISSNKLPSWFQKYIWLLLGLIVITLVLWIVGVQIFSPIIIPILLTLTIRYLFLHWKHTNDAVL